MGKTDYQKINTLFMRDEKHIIMPGHFTAPEFEYLKDNLWEATEKIDGTNIHCDITVNGTDIEIQICGRTPEAIIPPFLMDKLKQVFTVENIKEGMDKALEGPASDGSSFNISIYGEGYGAKIQKGGKNYIKDDVSFILFDVKVGNWWLSYNDCRNIADKMGVKIVPLVGYMTLTQAIDFVKKGFTSAVAENKNYIAEGLVLKTPDGLRFRNGQRIITKIKVEDFAKYKRVYGDEPVEQEPNPGYGK